MKEMEVSLTNEKIIDSSYALGGVAQNGMMVQAGLADQMIPSVALGFAIGENLTEVQKASKKYEEYKIKILKQHAIVGEDGELHPDEQGKVEFSTPEAEDQAGLDIKDLLQVEQTLNVTVFTIQELVDGGVKNIMPKILTALSWMIRKQADPDEKPVKSPLAGHRRPKGRR